MTAAAPAGLLLRADAGHGTGVGHVARCLAFAEEAAGRGWPVALSGFLEGADWLADRFAELGVRRLPPANTATDLARLAAGHRAVLVDHYDLPTDLRGPLNAAGVPLISLEDAGFGRRPADVVVDSGFATIPRPPDGSPLLLTGPEFAPLRRGVRAARESRAHRTAAEPLIVLVVMGGTDAAAILPTVLAALCATGRRLDIRAIAPRPIDRPATAPGQRITVEPPRPDLPALFAEADLVVSAAGVTLLELCCIGVPTAVLRIVDNQSRSYAAAVDRGLAAGLGSAEDLAADPGPAVDTLRELLDTPARRHTLATTAATAVDGRGAARVLDRIAN